MCFIFCRLCSKFGAGRQNRSRLCVLSQAEAAKILICPKFGTEPLLLVLLWCPSRRRNFLSQGIKGFYAVAPENRVAAWPLQHIKTRLVSLFRKVPVSWNGGWCRGRSRRRSAGAPHSLAGISQSWAWHQTHLIDSPDLPKCMPSRLPKMNTGCRNNETCQADRARQQAVQDHV